MRDSGHNLQYDNILRVAHIAQIAIKDNRPKMVVISGRQQ